MTPVAKLVVNDTCRWCGEPADTFTRLFFRLWRLRRPSHALPICYRCLDDNFPRQPRPGPAWPDVTQTTRTGGPLP